MLQWYVSTPQILLWRLGMTQKLAIYPPCNQSWFLQSILLHWLRWFRTCKIVLYAFHHPLLTSNLHYISPRRSKPYADPQLAMHLYAVYHPWLTSLLRMVAVFDRNSKRTGWLLCMSDMFPSIHDWLMDCGKLQSQTATYYNNEWRLGTNQMLQLQWHASLYALHHAMLTWPIRAISRKQANNEGLHWQLHWEMHHKF